MRVDPAIIARVRELKDHGLNIHEVVFLLNRDHPPSRGRWTADRLRTVLKSCIPQQLTTNDAKLTLQGKDRHEG